MLDFESAETASFRIEQSELQRWLDATNVIRATVLAGVEENPATETQHAALEAQVERFKEAADLLRSQLADALSERNEWREAFKHGIVANAVSSELEHSGGPDFA